MITLLKRILSGRQPRNDRNWSPDLEILPEITFQTETDVTIKNIRHCEYRSVSEYTVHHYDRTINLNDIQTVWFIVEPFSLVAAHTFLSFGLSDGTYLSISVEIRKQRGQQFSQLLVLLFLRRHELVYVVGDERDLIKLRTNYRQDDVYLYQGNASPEAAQALCAAMLKRATALQEKPEFYHPFTNTCLTNIRDHINALWPSRVPFDYRLIIATLADALAYQYALIDTSLPFRALKKQAYINTKAAAAANDPDFSRRIRSL